MSGMPSRTEKKYNLYGAASGRIKKAEQGIGMSGTPSRAEKKYNSYGMASGRPFNF